MTSTQKLTDTKQGIKLFTLRGLGYLVSRGLILTVSTGGQVVIGATLILIPMMIDFFKRQWDLQTKMEEYLPRCTFYQKTATSPSQGKAYEDVYKEIEILQIAILNFAHKMPPTFQELHYPQEAERMRMLQEAFGVKDDEINQLPDSILQSAELETETETGYA